MLESLGSSLSWCIVFFHPVALTVHNYDTVGFVEKQLVEDLLKECIKMHKFDHPNVLKLIGVCLDGGPAPYIIMPFMVHGSLMSYLRKERKELLLEPSAAMDETEVV